MSGRLILILVFLLLTPTAAAADPLTALIASVAKWFGGLSLFGKALVQLGLSALLQFAAVALASSPRNRRELSIPNSRPPKRHVWGRMSMYGSPAPWRVKGRVLVGCLILNSRPSAGGTVEVRVDKRRATLNGDPYDFSASGGAILEIEDFKPFSSSDDMPRVWIGRGDQTAPPAKILSEFSDVFEETDGWRGLTVMWFYANSGKNSDFAKRWRAAPPELEVVMDWSRIWDPRDTAQDPDDETTWQYSNNQALVLLDALRTNPIRRYPLSQIHLDSFVEGADTADESVDLFYESSSEPRYTANGYIAWANPELGDAIQPIASAGAGSLVRIGGRIGYAAGAYRAPLLTVTDFVDSGGIDYQVLQPGRDLPAFVKASYVAPRRDWQEAELPILAVPGVEGGVGEDAVLDMKLMFVTSPTQAMRVQKIMAMRMSAQKQLSLTLWPEAINVVAGCTIEVDFVPAFARLNGLWAVERAEPGIWLSESEEGVAMRVPITARPTAAAHYAWVPSEDEFEIINPEFDSSIDDFTDEDLPVPTNLALSDGGFSQILCSAAQPDSTEVAGVEFLFSDADDFETAEVIGVGAAEFGATVTVTTDPQTAGVYYVWARSVGGTAGVLGRTRSLPTASESFEVV